MTVKRIGIVLFLLGLLAGPAARAQNLYSGNPADGELLEAGFSNPALNAYLLDRLVLAGTSHQTGVAGKLFSIRSGVIGYHLPWKLRGLAVGAQYFNAGLYSQNNLRLSYGRKIHSLVALGADVNVFNRAYDQDEFYLFDPADPVFRNGSGKWGLSLGLGLAVTPLNLATFGLALEHLNRPDLALGESTVRQPMLLSAGVKLRLGAVNLFSSATALEFFRGDQAGTGGEDMLSQRLQFGAEVPVQHYGYLRLAGGSRALQAEAQAYLFADLYFNYRYEYPLTEINLASGGTHRFGFVFDFDRRRPLPDLSPLPDLPPMRLEAAAQPVAPRGQIMILTNADTIRVVQRHVRRSLAPDVPAYTLGLLFPEDLGDEAGLSVQTGKLPLTSLEVRDPTVLPREQYTSQYRGALEGIGFQMLDSRVQAEVVTYPGAERRGNALANLMTGNRRTVSEEVPIFAPDRIPLGWDRLARVLRSDDDFQAGVVPPRAEVKILPIYQRDYTGRWWLELRNGRDQVVYRQSGEGIPPDTYTWDWASLAAEQLTPGFYYLTFTFAGDRGDSELVSRKAFTVVHERISTQIDITRDPRIGEVDADKYILILRGKAPEGETPVTPEPPPQEHEEEK
ncbi:MAG: type IX secretion system membrane protein PorP/SprF [Candidatus Zixiibacteriota bacterium]|nr:MAG: type IX secretion system membrane protein PorP/SprF [candidate division Zixibacteria bacterium]